MREQYRHDCGPSSGCSRIPGPLAAGCVWLVFAYFVTGAPTEVNDAPGPLRELLTVSPTVATGIALSFVAYLSGSISQDLFGQVLPRLVAQVSRPLSHRRRYLVDRVAEQAITRATPEALEATTALHRIQLEVSEEERVRGVEEKRPIETKRQEARAHIEEKLGRLLSLLNELRAAGLSAIRADGSSEAEKPEALRPMKKAEVRLLTAIVPPLVAVMTYLTVAESEAWIIGLAFTVALLVQAIARDVEVRGLTDRHVRARSIEAIHKELEEVAKQLSRREGIDAGRLKADLEQLTTDLDLALSSNFGKEDSRRPHRE
jgi:hypothetical protein